MELRVWCFGLATERNARREAGEMGVHQRDEGLLVFVMDLQKIQAPCSLVSNTKFLILNYVQAGVNSVISKSLRLCDEPAVGCLLYRRAC